MRQCAKRLLLVIWAILIGAAGASAQTTEKPKEIWPKLNAVIELPRKTRLQIYGELQNGEDFPYMQWKVGTMLSHSMRQIRARHNQDIDDDNEHIITLGAAYEYLQTTQNDSTKRENRFILQAVPKYVVGPRLLILDRNRVEFRWVNGSYSTRYRNRLTVQRPFKNGNFRLTPYASGELFHDGKHDSWNENQYAFGVQFPFRRRMMLDTYYLHQNCTTCSEKSVNVFGITLNLYFNRKKK